MRRSRIPVSDADVFRQVLTNFIMSTIDAPVTTAPSPSATSSLQNLRAKAPGLKKIPPYWYPYTTMAKGRWLGREILEVVSTEFRDRSMEFYVRVSLSRCCRSSLNEACAVSVVEDLFKCNGCTEPQVAHALLGGDLHALRVQSVLIVHGRV